MTAEHMDVLVIGAGLSGIAAGYYLQTHCPEKSFAILEGRAAMGGTWDLFRYPGVRSDSDMYTLGYTFNPWHAPKAIADGPSILSYIQETAAQFDLEQKIRYNHRVRAISWSSSTAQWQVTIQQGDDTTHMTCNFLLMCTGYYNYEQGYTPHFDGRDTFKGQIIHPQRWPENLDYDGKRVVVIGSGATAVTLVPAMTDQAAHVTMLQRSPTYIASMPAEDDIANWMHRRLPARIAHILTRWKAILLTMFFYYLARWRPEAVKKTILDGVRDELGADYDVEKHFTPDYNPWDQRLCLVPDSDLFNAIKSGRASVVTDHIDHFTPDGIQLQSGEHIPADLIVTATGLDMQLLQGISITVDGAPISLADTMNYKGMMYSDIPNLAHAFGYTNASWTLKAELICEYVCRLLNYMDEHGYDQCVAKHNPDVETTPITHFTSGYIQRALDLLPQQGTQRPWKIYQNYIIDILTIKFGRLDNDALHFSHAREYGVAKPPEPMPEMI